jgi:DNA polymerase I-like protein with 3'-5' exonuclease and polymerase domains
MKLIGFDIETTGEGEAFGLQPYRVLQGRARITSAAFVTEEGETLWASLNPSVDDLRVMLRKISIQCSDSVLIGWNTLFDVAWLIAVGLEKEVRSCRWLDGEVLRRALENDTTDKSYGLKPTVAKYLPEFAGYEGKVGGNFDEINEELLKYNIMDSGLTAKLGRIFIDQLDQRRAALAGVISQCIVPVAASWVEGLCVDPTALDVWEEDCEKKAEEALEKIHSMLDVDYEIDDSFLNSPIRLKKILNTLGHQVSATDQAELSRFKGVPLIKAISEYKKANTSRTKFIAGIRKSLQYNESDRTHPSCRLWNTYTGRFGYSSKTLKKFQTGIAIHQFSREKVARSCIVAPKGYVLAEYDFATQEPRLICDYSGDETLLQIFTDGLDFHTYMAANVVQKDYDDLLARFKDGDPQAIQDRYLGKVANLSCQYRIGWKTLILRARVQYDVELSESMSKALISTYKRTYNKVPIYWDTAIESAKSQGYAETRGGRRVILDDWSRQNSWSAESTALNFPIQGTGADMKVLGIAMIDDMLYEAGGKYLLDLHDALFCLLPDTSVGYDVASKIKEVLSNLPYRQIYNWSPRVSLPVDLKIGPSWGTLKDVN